MSDIPRPTQHYPIFGPPKDEKYIVFKREEFFQMMGALALPPGSGASSDLDCASIAAEILSQAKETEVSDAVVIRRKDIFAASALHAYADAIQTTIEVMRESGHQAPEHLHNIYIYFKEQATAAEIAPDKGVPD